MLFLKQPNNLPFMKQPSLVSPKIGINTPDPKRYLNGTSKQLCVFLNKRILTVEDSFTVGRVVNLINAL